MSSDDLMTKRLNLEKQIEMMLEDVLKDESEPNLIKNKKFNSGNFYFQNKNKLTPTIVEHNLRKDTKAKTTEIKIIENSVRLFNFEDEGNSFQRELPLQSPKRKYKNDLFVENVGNCSKNNFLGESSANIRIKCLKELSMIKTNYGSLAMTSQSRRTSSCMSDDGLNLEIELLKNIDEEKYINSVFTYSNEENQNLFSVPNISEDENSIMKNFALNSLQSYDKICYKDSSNFKNEKIYGEMANNILKNQNTISTLSYQKMKGFFFKILQTQKGSRIIQQKIKTSEKKVISFIFYEIIKQIPELMMNHYGNYFIQNLFDELNQSERIIFLNSIFDSIITISKNKTGTYPIQGMIEVITQKEEMKIIIESIIPEFYALCLDLNGVHVVEKILEYFDKSLLKSLHDLIFEKFEILSNNFYGLGVVKKIIINPINSQILNRVLIKIIENFFILIENPYGNYTIQFALDNWKIEDLSHLMKLFINKFVMLSMQKYSSNVVEKCLERGGHYLINLFLEEITLKNSVVKLMKNSYGNFVVQKVLNLAEGNDKINLINLIIRNIHKIGDRKLINKWREIIQNHMVNYNSNLKYFNNIIPKMDTINFANYLNISNQIPNHNIFMQRDLYSNGNNYYNLQYNNINLNVINNSSQNHLMNRQNNLQNFNKTSFNNNINNNNFYSCNK